MNIQSNVPLHNYSTMRIGGTAAYMATITNDADIQEAVAFAKKNALLMKVIGGGSNVFWGDFAGIVLHNKILDYAVQGTTVTVGAGNNWDETVERTITDGLRGLECLSWIPGTCGAVPVQNVGAYGTEISQVLLSVRAYDLQLDQFVHIPVSECVLRYRSSRFNGVDKDRFIITHVTLQLHTNEPIRPLYKALEEYITQHQITDLSASSIRAAVIAIRTAKLPDPNTVPNCGSFFKNPIIPSGQFDTLLAQYPTMPNWPMKQGYKIAAAWLLEQAGFANYSDSETGMGTFPKQPLVVINQHATTSHDVLHFAQKIIDTVYAKFGITLEREPEFVGA